VGPSPEAKKTLIFNVDAHADSKSAAASAAAAAPVVTQPVYIKANGEVDYDAIPALVVLRNPDKYLKDYVRHKVETLPDMTDRVEYKPSDLCFWQKNTSGKVTKGPHKILPGMCAKWLHKACDFCIAKGYYPVMFEKRGELIDLTVQFITVQHMVYVACMNGSPSTTSNAAIKVLKYLLMNKNKVVKCWRQRLYNYASASIFNECTVSLHKWIYDEPKGDEKEIKLRKKNLVKLNPHDRVSYSACKPHICVFIQTHICLLKHTFAFLKSHICLSNHTFVFIKHTFVFQNTHLLL
jgi:hypothetical protein